MLLGNSKVEAHPEKEEKTIQKKLPCCRAIIPLCHAAETLARFQSCVDALWLICQDAEVEPQVLQLRWQSSPELEAQLRPKLRASCRLWRTFLGPPRPIGHVKRAKRVRIMELKTHE